MKEWILQNLDATVIASVASVVGSVAMAIIGLVKSSRMRKRYVKLVEEIKTRLTYTNCPHCGKKVYFAELSWHLPDGSKDNNLDGVPDDQE